MEFLRKGWLRTLKACTARSALAMPLSHFNCLQATMKASWHVLSVALLVSTAWAQPFSMDASAYPFLESTTDPGHDLLGLGSVPGFLHSALLMGLHAVQDHTSEDSTGGLLDPLSIRNQAQSWASKLSAQLNSSNLNMLSGNHLGLWPDASASIMKLVDQLITVKPALQRVYFNYWNATYQRYAGYIDDVRLSLGFSPDGPLIEELVARFREITGTTCTPASFAPPAESSAAITGKGVVFTLDGGSCQLVRTAIQVRRDFNVRCVVSSTSLAITQPRYSAKYVEPVKFRSSVCRRQFTYGLDSEVRIELWNPGAFAQENSTKFQLLPLSDADGNGVPNFLDKLGKYDTVRQVLRSFRKDLTSSVSLTTTTVQKLSQQLSEKLAQAGLDVRVERGIAAFANERNAKRLTREAAFRDLSQIFPDLTNWRLGEGVKHIYEQVLEQGLLSTLYRVGPKRGPFSMFNLQSRMGQSAQGVAQEEASQADDGPQDETQQLGSIPQDIFRKLADEMDKLLTARTVAQELVEHPPTGRKVVRQAQQQPPPPEAQGQQHEQLGEIAAQLMQGMRTAFASVADMDDGGVEVPPL